jgi:hypothetical protein
MTQEIVPIPTRDLARAGFENLPVTIARAGVKAAWRFIEFFAANIRNRNTRAAYAEATPFRFRGLLTNLIRAAEGIAFAAARMGRNCLEWAGKAEKL